MYFFRMAVGLIMVGYNDRDVYVYVYGRVGFESELGSSIIFRKCTGIV